MNVSGLEYPALGLALGFLIGIERGWTSRDAEPGSRVAGIRTFALLGLTGALAGELAVRLHVAAGILLLAAAAILVLIGYRRSLDGEAANVSATNPIVMLITLCIGMLATSGEPVLASATAAVMTLLLSMRARLHGWLGQLSEAELHAIARFALISLAILPLLPDRAMGPFDAWNPRHLWTMVVIVSGLSFAAYFATRRLGASRGIIVTAAAGAMISSTAVTAALATRLRAGGDERAPLIAGIAAASAVMFLRVLVMTALLAPYALSSLAIIVGAPTVISLICMGWQLRRAMAARADDMAIPVRNPLDIRPALILVGLVMAASVIARFVLDRHGDAGLATVLALTGMLDVDSAIITMGGLPPGTLEPRLSGLILSLPVMLNTLLKSLVTISIAGWRSGWTAALPLALSSLGALPALPYLLLG